jgi:hypothetical protein
VRLAVGLMAAGAMPATISHDQIMAINAASNR